MEDMVQGTEYKKKVNKFIVGLSFFYLAVFFLTYDAKLTIYNSTLLSFSYKYGFIPRAFVGTIYEGLNWILPVDMYSYGMAMRFVEVCTAIFFLLMIWIARKTLLLVGEKYFKTIGVVWIIYGIMFVSMFSSKYNFGRVDLFMLLIDAIGICLLMKRKGEWLLIPLSVIGVMVHEGFVFMYFSTILVILIYRFFMTEEKKKYGWIFALSLVGASVTFLYFMFFRTPVDRETYLSIYRMARDLSYEGRPHISLLSAELLCVNLGDIEKAFHKENFLQLPFFVLMVSPFLVFLCRLGRSLYLKAKGMKEKLAYLAVMIGWMTLIPNFALKVDYGRWIFAAFSFFFIVFIMMYVEQDKYFIQSFEIECNRYRKHPGVEELMIIYLIALVPLQDVYINAMLKKLSDFINVYLQWY
ncbi:MAG: hypothetical protein K6F30_05015 [Lachnospiraceae bacterium]|nr:hypothetical protein [Lachnospiraceae bacterium]